MFQLKLEITKKDDGNKSFQHPDFSFDEEHIIVLLNQLCSEIENKGELIFKVAGCGLNNWHTDIQTDLCVILEQLPEFITEMQTTSKGVLDFYEQGQERTLEVVIESSFVRIFCKSYSVDWSPNPSEEIMSFSEWNDTIKTFIETFLNFTETFYPFFHFHDLFQTHFSGLIIYKKK